MSFLSVLQHITRGAAIATNVAAPFAPVISAIPNVGPVFSAIWAGVTAAEQALPQAGAGPAKKLVASTVTTAMQPQVEATKLSGWIDDAVAALNALQKVAQATDTPPPK